MPTATTEILALRQRRRKVYATDEPGVQIARLFSHDVHYQKPDGSLDDRASMVQPSAGGFVVDGLAARVGIESGWLTITRSGRELRMRPASIGMVDRTAPASRWRKLAAADYSSVTRDGLTVTVHDIFPQTDLTVLLDEWGFRKAFTIRQRPNVPDPVSLGWDPSKTFIVIVWDVQLPSGVIVKDAVTEEVVGSGYAGQNDLVLEAAGTEVFRFLKGEASTAVRGGHPVWYVVGPNVPFGEAFAYDKWALATFPVVLDPTTSIYPSTNPDDGQVSVSYLWEGTPTYSAVTSQAYISMGWLSVYDEGYKVWQYTEYARAFWRFSLSGIPSTITAAALSLVAYGTGSTSHDSNVEKTADWSPLDASDWSLAGTQVGQITGAWSQDTRYDTTLDTTAVNASAGGVLALRARAAGSLGYRTCYGVAYTGTLYDPYLEVTYTGGSQNYDRTAGDSVSSLTAAVARAGTFARRESRPGD